MQSNGRLKYVDAAKGFAVLLLVLYHAVNGYWQSNTYAENSELNFAISNIISSFTVSLFCLLSGIVYDKVYFDDGNLKFKKWLKQAVNIFLLYVIYEIVYILFKSLVSAHVVNPVTVSDIKNIWRTSYGPYWYLYNLFFFYLFFAIPVLKRIPPAVIVLLLIGCSLFYVNGIYALCFYLGILLSRDDNLMLFDYRLGIVCGIIYTAVMMLFWKDGSLIIDTRFANLLSSFCGSVFLVSVFRNIKLIGESDVLGFFGKKSMEIFLWHQPIIMVCRVVMIKLGINTEIIALLLTMVIATGIPVAFSQIAFNTFLYNLAFKPAKIVYNFIDSIKH